MAKRNKKTATKLPKQAKPLHETVRNWAAVAAHGRSGGGAHGDRRTKRQRTRSDQKRSVFAEY